MISISQGRLQSDWSLAPWMRSTPDWDAPIGCADVQFPAYDVDLDSYWTVPLNMGQLNDFIRLNVLPIPACEGKVRIAYSSVDTTSKAMAVVLDNYGNYQELNDASTLSAYLNEAIAESKLKGENVVIVYHNQHTDLAQARELSRLAHDLPVDRYLTEYFDYYPSKQLAKIAPETEALKAIAAEVALVDQNHWYSTLGDNPDSKTIGVIDQSIDERQWLSAWGAQALAKAPTPEARLRVLQWNAMYHDAILTSGNDPLFFQKLNERFKGIEYLRSKGVPVQGLIAPVAAAIDPTTKNTPYYPIGRSPIKGLSTLGDYYFLKMHDVFAGKTINEQLRKQKGLGPSVILVDIGTLHRGMESYIDQRGTRLIVVDTPEWVGTVNQTLIGG